MRAAPHCLSLPEGLWDVVQPAEFPEHRLRWRNDRAAASIGLRLDDSGWIEHFARFTPLRDNLPQPLALRYHGHQFGHYNPDLGDGRGFLFAQVEADGRLLDLGTKGSGQTPWSRGGDGRLTLKGGVRELLATETLSALGVNTSQTLSLVETGEQLHRHDEPSPTRSCVLVRLSHGHVRFGTFQRLATLGQRDLAAALLAYCTEHLLPVLPHRDQAAAFLREVSRRQGVLTGQWMVAGFVHGVLNTDNNVITGESFDFGPYRFLPRYDPEYVAAYFDHAGLYRYSQQPSRMLWNLQRLAEALRPVGDPASLARATAAFEPAFRESVRQAMCRRLGVWSRGAAQDEALVDATFGFLRRSQVPMDRFFFDWYGGPAAEGRALRSPCSPSYEGGDFHPLRSALLACEPRWPARLGHPILEQPEPPTCVIGVVEDLWSAIDERDDWRPLRAHVARLRQLGELYD